MLLSLLAVITFATYTADAQTSNAFVTTLALSGPESNVVFSSGQFSGFSSDVAKAFGAVLSDTNVGAHCTFNYSSPSTSALASSSSTTTTLTTTSSSTTVDVTTLNATLTDATSAPMSTTSTSTTTSASPPLSTSAATFSSSQIVCVVSALVKASSSSVYPTYSTLSRLSANYSDTYFRNAILWPIRSSFSNRFDLDNSKVSTNQMLVTAPCRNSQLTNPATPAPGNPTQCNGTKGKVADYALVLTYRSAVTPSSGSTFVCTALVLDAATCAARVTSIAEGSTVLVVTVTGQANVLTSVATVISYIRLQSSTSVTRIALKPSLTADSSTAAPLFDAVNEARIVTGTTISCALSDYIWLVCLIIVIPIAYILLWTTYRCGRRHGKKKEEKRLDSADMKAKSMTAGSGEGGFNGLSSQSQASINQNSVASPMLLGTPHQFTQMYSPQGPAGQMSQQQYNMMMLQQQQQMQQLQQMQQMQQYMPQAQQQYLQQQLNQQQLQQLQQQQFAQPQLYAQK